jgi:tripartite-type tricarboxylate transporter receptor subunit TctC
VRALAVTSAKRSAIAPELPTVAEAGVPGFELTPWYGVLTRAGTPENVLAKLNQDIVRILRERAMHEHISKLGGEPAAMTREQFAGFLRTEAVKWGKLVRDSGAQPE